MLEGWEGFFSFCNELRGFYSNCRVRVEVYIEWKNFLDLVRRFFLVRFFEGVGTLWRYVFFKKCEGYFFSIGRKDSCVDK